ncbi:SEL1-like repeat protein [Streptomyces sp. BV286]|uniref:tetratricopeptide repeat protein n=1 Tax=Streptomyces sp. BV286 TaxID=2849672 RepID=UPI001C2E3382|nr:SEL1-like repeat protein [Streptomyces sp. BV286]MBV1940196.1 SEL1-like repeat protein [Streptomyces sp. BV286]
MKRGESASGTSRHKAIAGTSRLIARPRVAPGPLRELKDLTYEAYVSAGAPTLNELSDRMIDDDEVDACPSRDTIARLIGMPEAPAKQADVVALVELLTAMAGGDGPAAGRQAARLWTRIQLAEPLGRHISALDPYELDVHRVVALEGHTGLTPYLDRDHDTRLREIVTDAVTGLSRLAMLVGNSSTGKTRACWEALRQLPSGWRLWRPADPERATDALADLDHVGPRTVVWLDEAHHHLLSRSQGEAIADKVRGLLADGSRAPVLVLGTIWSGLEYFELLTRAPALNEPDPHKQARRLLAGQHLHVPSSFGPDAIEALRTSSDPRLITAARFASDGMVAQYLAGAPTLLDIYNAAVPETRALLQAAMDARRLGHPRGIPLPFLTAAAEAYISDTDWDLTDDHDWPEKPLAILTKPVMGARGPLHPLKRPRGAGPRSARGVPQAYRLADYLDQYGRSERLLDHVPELFWQAARTHCGPEVAGLFALEAANRGVVRHACSLWIRAGRHDRAAELLAEAGRLTEALDWIDKAASAGRTDCLSVAGDWLMRAGRVDEAQRWYERAVAAGHSGILCHVADQLLLADRVQEALSWYERAIEADHFESLPHAAQQLVAAGLLDRAGPPWSLPLRTAAEIDHWATKSTQWYTTATVAGSSEALRQVTDGLVGAARPDEALRWFELAAEAGHTEALQLAAELLIGEGRLDEALDWCERALAAGHADALQKVAGRVEDPSENIDWFERAAALGQLSVLRPAAEHLAAVGRLDEALDRYGRIADAGCTEVLTEAADHLADAGRMDEALGWYERAAAAGHVEALQLVADCRANMGDLDTALAWYERAWAAGQPEALMAAATELSTSGREEEALHWYRRAAEAGYAEACVHAAVELILADRSAEAVDWCHKVIESGGWPAKRVALYEQIAQQLAHLGYLDEASEWGDLAASEGPTHVHAEVGGHLLAEGRRADALLCFDRAAAAGGTDVLASVGAELAKAEGLDQALPWYERAAAAGHTNALTEAANQLADGKRLDEALPWYERAAAAGHTNALAEAADQLSKVKRLDEALPWYERAAAAGHTNALAEAAGRLVRAERLDEALPWYRRAAVAGAAAPDEAQDVLRKLGNADLAARLHAYGYTPEGDIAAEWTTADCE